MAREHAGASTDGGSSLTEFMNTKDLLITSAYSVPLNGQTPAEIMYMPAGKSKIRANVNGKPKEITVDVSKQTVDVLQASLAKLFTEPVQPFIDFNHKEDESAAIPTKFSWSDEGVMLALDWTSAGKAAVEGKTYRYFSPTFLLSEAGEPTSLPETGPVGALTNNPAFRKMKKITAADAALTGEEAETKGKPKMADETADTVTASLRTEIETLRSENKTLKDSIESQRVEAVNREADILIEAAVREGRIEPKNDKVKAGLKKFYLIDSDGAKAAIDALPVNPAFKTIVNVTAAHRDIGTPPVATSNGDSGKVCNAKVRAVQARFPAGQCTYEHAWEIAAQESPEIFQKVEA